MQNAVDHSTLTSGDNREVEHGLSVKLQVQKLILQATSHENLCQNYVGYDALLFLFFPCLYLVVFLVHVCLYMCSGILLKGIYWIFIYIVGYVKMTNRKAPQHNLSVYLFLSFSFLF